MLGETSTGWVERKQIKERGGGVKGKMQRTQGDEVRDFGLGAYAIAGGYYN